MTDSSDRTPPPADPGRPSQGAVPRPSGPRPLFSDDEPTGTGEEATQVHSTTGAPSGPDVTGYTPAPGAGTGSAGSTGAVPAPGTTGSTGTVPAAGPATAPGAAAAPAAGPVPADAAVAAPPAKVSVRNRGRMRRRLRYLRRVRELGYRDLGGLVFELRRARVENEVLVGAKVDALYAIDHELHALEHGLRDHRSVEELYEPGVSVCLRCGALHGSDANFCPQCGIRVDGQGVPAGQAEPATVVPPPAPGTTGTIAAPGDQATGRERR